MTECWHYIGRDIEQLARILHDEFSRRHEPDASWDSRTNEQRDMWRQSAAVVAKTFEVPHD